MDEYIGFRQSLLRRLSAAGTPVPKFDVDLAGWIAKWKHRLFRAMQPEPPPNWAALTKNLKGFLHHNMAFHQDCSARLQTDKDHNVSFSIPSVNAAFNSTISDDERSGTIYVKKVDEQEILLWFKNGTLHSLVYSDKRRRLTFATF